MRKKETVNNVQETVVTWIASDGTEFKCESNCRDYEDTFKCIISERFNRIPKVKLDGLNLCLYDYTLYALFPQNQSEIDTVNMYALRSTSEKLWKDRFVDAERARKGILYAEYTDCDDGYFPTETLDDVMNSLTETISEFKSKLKHD